MTIRVTVWNENIHERTNEQIARLYPKGIHGAIAEGIEPYGFQVRTATMDEPEQGLPEQTLRETDVLIYWGHAAHQQVQDEVVQRIYDRVVGGMGIIFLHSAQGSKIFNRLLGASQPKIKWREADEKERLWVVNPAHPIAAGIGECIELEQEEMYGEFFNIPRPDELVFISWFEGGEVFRSGVTYHRGSGKIFYFRPGHESNPTFYHPEILRVIANAVQWAAPSRSGASPIVYGNVPPLEPLRSKR
jgi:trehalose utilization protein